MQISITFDPQHDAAEDVALAIAYAYGYETVEDLLYHLPFRYEDRLHPRPIAELARVVPPPSRLPASTPPASGLHGIRPTPSSSQSGFISRSSSRYRRL